MREDLDSTRAALARATTATDSTRLAERITGREYGISRREYHVPHRQARLDRWWQPTGPGTLTVAFGVALVLVGLALRRRKTARDLQSS